MADRFMFHTLAAAARAVLAVLRDERLQENAQVVSKG